MAGSDTDALLIHVAAAMLRPPSAGERRQLAIMQTGVALDALRAGDLGAASMFLEDAVLHLNAALGRPPVTERHGLRASWPA